MRSVKTKNPIAIDKVNVNKFETHLDAIEEQVNLQVPTESDAEDEKSSLSGTKKSSDKKSGGKKSDKVSSKGKLLKIGSGSTVRLEDI